MGVNPRLQKKDQKKHERKHIHIQNCSGAEHKRPSSSGGSRPSGRGNSNRHLALLDSANFIYLLIVPI